MAVKAVICAAFILLTSPVAAHAVCRGAYLSGVPLWEGSVEDRFAGRAQTLRTNAEEGPSNDAETEAA
jgi:multicomponent Na+:H+ antiporter subunit G